MSLTATVYCLQEYRDSDSIELSKDDYEEVDFAYNNLFEKFCGLTKLNKKVFKKFKEIDFEKKKKCLLN